MGKIELDHTGTGGGITLSSDGTDLLLDGTAIGGGGAALSIDNKTAAYTVVASDLGKIINCTSGTFTVSLTAAATLSAGFNVTIWNTSATVSHVVTIDPDASETIDGVVTLLLGRGEGVKIVCNGTNWETSNKKLMRGYAENYPANAARPVASGDYSFSVGAGGTTASNTNAVAIGRNARAIGNSSVALANALASGSSSIAIGQFTIASASNSEAIGTNSSGGGSIAEASGAMALGGSRASGTDSFAAAIANNTSSYGATGANSVAIGRTNRSTQSYATTLGGYLAEATATYSTVVGGRQNTADATYSVASGYGAEVRGIIGKVVHSPIVWISSGDTQTGTLVLTAATTNATPKAATSNGASAGTTNQVILPNNSAYAFSGTIVARQQASTGTACAAWKVEGLIRREGSAGTTVLVNSATTVLDNTPAWGMALSADTTNGGLKIEVTGAAATNIRWVATINTSECSY